MRDWLERIIGGAIVVLIVTGIVAATAGVGLGMVTLIVGTVCVLAGA